MKQLGKIAIFGASMLVGVPTATIEMVARGFEGVSPTEMRQCNVLADKMGRKEIQAELKKQLTLDQFDSLKVAIEGTPLQKQPYEWPHVDSVLGKARSLAPDSADKLVKQTIAKFKAQKAPDAFMISLLKKINQILN